MTKQGSDTTSYFSEIGGDFKGTQGDNYGSITQYIITQKSGIDICKQNLRPGSPYLGLQKFNEGDKDKFFGRDRKILEFKEYFRERNALLLLGASGSGKSSLIQAGLIPTLKDEWGSQSKSLVFTPSNNPFKSFLNCLSRSIEVEDISSFDSEEDIFAQVFKSLRYETKWLIFIDQFEELFTRTKSTERALFVKSLYRLTERLREEKDSSTKIILAMRADFLDKFNDYPSLGNIHELYGSMLTKMGESDLRLAIAEPAARNGVIFENELVDQIINDFNQQEVSLPLLQYTLDKLWEKEKEDNSLQERVLRTETYYRLGGVQEALQQQADEIYYNKKNNKRYLISSNERKAADQIFLGLIELRGREPLSRKANKSEFLDSDIKESALEKLITNRLLVSAQNSESSTIEVAHEALLRSWKVILRLIEEQQEVIILRNRLYDDTEHWKGMVDRGSEKADLELWSGRKLEQILELQDSNLDLFDDTLRSFISASIAKRDRVEKEKQANQQKEEQRLRKESIRNRRIAFSAVSAGLVMAGLAVFTAIKSKEAVRENVSALAQTSESLLAFEYKKLDALFYSLVAGTRFKEARLRDPVLQQAVAGTLQQTIYYDRYQEDPFLSESNKLIGHSGDVSSVSLSPTDDLLVSASGDGTIKLWTPEGQLIQTLEDHEGPVNGVTFTSNGEVIASGSDDGTIKLWTPEGQLIQTLEDHEGPVTSVDFNPVDGTLVSGGADGTIKLWDKNGEVRLTLNGRSRNPANTAVTSVRFNPDGKAFVSASWGTIQVWAVDGRELQDLKAHNDRILGFSFSRGDSPAILASASGDNAIKIWRFDGKKLQRISGHNNYVYSAAFSPNGETIVSGSKDKTIKLWNLDGKELKTFEGHQEEVNSVSFDPDGKNIASGSSDGTIRLWNLDGQNLKTFEGDQGSIFSIDFSPDGKTIVSAGEDGSLKLWSLDGQNLQTFKGHQGIVYSVSFSPDGQTIASGGEDKNIWLWSLDGQNLQTFKGHQGIVFSVSFSPDGQTIASGSQDSTIRLWDLDGHERKVFFGHRAAVMNINFGPEGRILASASSDSQIKLWSLSGQELKTLNGHGFFTDEDREKDTHENTGSVYSVSFSPDGMSLLSASADQKMILWDFNLDALLEHGCSWLRDYIETNLRNENHRDICQ